MLGISLARFLSFSLALLELTSIDLRILACYEIDAGIKFLLIPGKAGKLSLYSSFLPASNNSVDLFNVTDWLLSIEDCSFILKPFLLTF